MQLVHLSVDLSRLGWELRKPYKELSGFPMADFLQAGCRSGRRTNSVEALYDTDDVNQGYNYLETKIKQSYLNNFKLVRLSRNRAKDKIWITPGLKHSSKHKNKLYK